MFFEQKILKEVCRDRKTKLQVPTEGFQSIKFMKDGSFKVINLVEDENYMKSLNDKNLILSIYCTTKDGTSNSQ